MSNTPAKKKTTYERKLIRQLKKSGKKRIWLAKKLSWSRSKLWRKVKGNLLTAAEKKRIDSLLKS